VDLAEQSICFAAEAVRNRINDFVSNMDRPSVIYRPKLSLDGNMWIALFGDNLQEGVVGIGTSPNEAMYQFDNAWYEKTDALSPNSEGKR
jgi:hypothetical protein